MRGPIIAGLLFAGLALADASQDVYNLVASMASALAEDNATDFANSLSKDMPGRDAVIKDVRAMLAQANTASTVVPGENEGDDSKRTIAVEWTLNMKRRGEDVRSDQRRAEVTITAVREGKKWKVTSIEPLSFFAPPDFR